MSVHCKICNKNILCALIINDECNYRHVARRLDGVVPHGEKQHNWTWHRKMEGALFAKWEPKGIVFKILIMRYWV